MQRIVSFLALCIAVAVAQSRLTTLTTILNGTTVTGSWTNTATTPFPQAPVLYQLWVPNNAQAIAFTLTNTGTEGCDYIDIAINSVAPPCITDDFPSGYNTYSYYCALYDNLFYVSTGNTVSTTVEAGDYEDSFQWQVGTYLYIGIYPEGEYVGETCSFNLNVQINQTCAPDSLELYSSPNFCAPEMNMTNNFNYSTTVPVAQADNYFQLFHTVVPENTGSVTVQMQASVDLYLYGASRFPASDYRNDCEESTSSNSDDVYTLTMICPVPLSGDFYLLVMPYYSESSAFNYSIQVTTQACGTGFAGVNCVYPLTYLTLANFTNGNVIQINGLVENETDIYNLDYSENYRYFVFNTQNLSLATPALVVSAVSTQSAYLQVRTGNAPFYSALLDSSYQEMSIGTTGDYWIYIYADYFVGQNQYFGVYCYSSTPCDITITLNATALVDTSTSATSATTTGVTGASTTGVTGVSTTGVTGVSTTGTTAVTGVATTAVTGTVVTTASASTLAVSIAAVFVAALLI